MPMMLSLRRPQLILEILPAPMYGNPKKFAARH